MSAAEHGSSFWVALSRTLVPFLHLLGVLALPLRRTLPRAGTAYRFLPHILFRLPTYPAVQIPSHLSVSPASLSDTDRAIQEPAAVVAEQPPPADKPNLVPEDALQGLVRAASPCMLAEPATVLAPHLRSLRSATIKASAHGSQSEVWRRLIRHPRLLPQA